MDSLRIALVAPPWFTVPPAGYGGVEWVVSHLAEGLVGRGHEVTLFAPGGSKTSARLVSAYDEAPSSLLGDAMVESYHIAHAYDRCRTGFDIVHDHTMLGLLAAAQLSVPAIHTVHGSVDACNARLYTELAERVHYVTVSRNQATTMPPQCRVTPIPNPVDIALFPPSEEKDDYLLFVGRMNRDKGVLSAIEIARRSERPLLILAKMNERPERDYFEQEVRPVLAGLDVDLRDQVEHAEKARAFARAYATLFPIQWAEPFGLVMAESMAAGTPVIAFACGAAPEVIRNGTTGFLVESVDEAVDAVERIPQIRPADCRAHVQQQFGPAVHAARHEALYAALLGIGPHPGAEA